jgi:hypothetical protein
MSDLIESQTFRSLCYLVAAGFCALVSIRWSRDRSYANGWLYWAGACCLMLSFGLLKVSGVEHVVQEAGRDIADEGGFYDVRRGYQLAIIIAILWSGGLWILGFVIAMREQMLIRLLPGLVSVTALACYVLARGVSYHKVDSLLYRRQFIGIQNSAFFEVVLLAVAVAVAIHAARAATDDGAWHNPAGAWLGRFLRSRPLRP